MARRKYAKTSVDFLRSHNIDMSNEMLGLIDVEVYPSKLPRSSARR